MSSKSNSSSSSGSSSHPLQSTSSSTSCSSASHLLFASSSRNLQAYRGVLQGLQGLHSSIPASSKTLRLSLQLRLASRSLLLLLLLLLDRRVLPGFKGPCSMTSSKSLQLHRHKLHLLCRLASRRAPGHNHQTWCCCLPPRASSNEPGSSQTLTAPIRM